MERRVGSLKKTRGIKKKIAERKRLKLELHPWFGKDQKVPLDFSSGKAPNKKKG